MGKKRLTKHNIHNFRIPFYHAMKLDSGLTLTLFNKCKAQFLELKYNKLLICKQNKSKMN